MPQEHADADALASRYQQIASAQPRQQEAYTAWLKSGKVDGSALIAKAEALGLTLDLATGQIKYAPDFTSRCQKLCFDLIYCRHGKTTGNTEPRVYQGYVDEPSNALNEIGLAQAQEAAGAHATNGVAWDVGPQAGGFGRSNDAQASKSFSGERCVHRRRTVQPVVLECRRLRLVVGFR